MAFRHIPVSSVEEALAAMKEHGEEGKIYAGGVALSILMKSKIFEPEALIDIAGVADAPVGIMTDEADAAEKLVDVQLFGASSRTILMVASEAITAGSEVYTAASGKVQNEPVVAGTYYRVGLALTAAAADLDELSVDPRDPVKYIVT